MRDLPQIHPWILPTLMLSLRHAILQLNTVLAAAGECCPVYRRSVPAALACHKARRRGLLRAIYGGPPASGSAIKKPALYPALTGVLDVVGATLYPQVCRVPTLRNRRCLEP
jgi:hypothetical protein